MNFKTAFSVSTLTAMRGVAALVLISTGAMTPPKAYAEGPWIRCTRGSGQYFNVKYQANAPSLTPGGTFILHWHDPRAVNPRVESYQWKNGHRWNLTDNNGHKWSYVDNSTRVRGFKMYNLDNETLIECISNE